MIQVSSGGVRTIAPSLADIQEAFDYSESGRAKGKIIIKMAD
ncbi:hypothetical protein [Enterococcus xiangfangensis]|uniref:Zinc-binding dehydrogenase n=1 Tax=Enterococcus xiangfangensis TaxID=1296537 RepID=A0ABU3F8B8_9ENTE|nr:hypothetical protein [Enterococcus xiangfangensis]MBM7712234.1 hypothetical protein [Enterococcus xiangfangensis]MDT2758903.1 hypothetical protein [Enterococcus xiangfangensis]